MVSKARYIVPEPHTFFMTRTTNLNQNRLTPTQETNNSFVYHIAYELERHDIDPNIILTLPDQYFLIATTNESSDLPRFTRNFHSILARDLNSTQGQSGHFWRDKSYYYAPVFDYPELVRRTAKVVTKMVKAGLVGDPDDWQGVQLRPDASGVGNQTATKPEFCGNRGPKPQTIDLTVINSPLLGDRTPEQFVDDVNKIVRAEINELSATSELEGVELLTPDEQIAIEPLEFALPIQEIVTTNDHLLTEIIANHPEHVAHRQRVRAFRRAYRHAFQEWQQATDKNSVIFPFGTYKMRVIYGLPCHPPVALE